jgi:predicted DCC family thiol-disulfide oxidoreductase YuxK
VPAPILLYDGLCGLCHRVVQFILRHDRRAIFRFASLHSAASAEVLARHGRDANHLDTVYVVVRAGEADEVLLSRSNAVLHVLQRLGGTWRTTALFLQLIPEDLRNLAYNLIARYRYRIFGRSDTCIIPSPPYRDRFLDPP